MELTDAYGTRRTSLRPYLAVDRDQGDSQVLLGMPALMELKILVDCEAYQWQYKLEKTDIRIETYRQFQKRSKGAKIYALIEVNHLLWPDQLFVFTVLVNQFLTCLGRYTNVFSDANAKKLAPNRDIDLAIELQPGKEPSYGPIYLLSP